MPTPLRSRPTARPSRPTRPRHPARRLAGLLALIVLVPMLIAASPSPNRTVGALPTPGDFVEQQYLDFLSRSPDAGGAAHWEAQLDAGMSPAAVVEALALSPEFEGTLAPIVRLYYAHFRRAPDYQGMTYWAGVARSGASVEQISEQFVLSGEFQRAYGSLDDAAYVDQVYRNVLNRGADASGAAYWRGQLAAGVSRGAVMVAFSDSTEYRNRTGGQVLATMLYVGMLNRAPEPNGLAYWTQVIDGGTPYRDVIAAFLGSNEYRARMNDIFDQTQPLTGIATRQAALRAALAVKIDNVDSARPPTNLDRADIIYEEMVEGNLTRLIAVFHSDVPDVVGPVRSIRTSDIDILAQFNTPLLAASGANDGVLARVADADLINVNASAVPGAYFRSTSRSAPHNMYTHPFHLYVAADSRGGLPDPVFTYREPGEGPVGGVSAPAGVRVEYGRATAEFSWSHTAQGWARSQNGTAHVTADGTQLAPENVVVMEIDYGASPADFGSPHAHTVGTGTAHVFTGGQRIAATWNRERASDPIVLKDGAGRVIELTRGQTFVELAPKGTVHNR